MQNVYIPELYELVIVGEVMAMAVGGGAVGGLPIQGVAPVAWGPTPRAGGPPGFLYDFVKSALLEQLVASGAKVCDIFCGGRTDVAKWAQAGIEYYVGVDMSASGLEEAHEEWERQGRPYLADFCALNPISDDLEMKLHDKGLPYDVVCCLGHLQDCFSSEDEVKSLLQNVASVLKPGGFFFGITPDSSTLWVKYQKAVEGALKSGILRAGVLPRVKNDIYTINFEDDRFSLFGTKYQIQFGDDGLAAQTQLLVHFPSLIRLAGDAGLDYIEIQNLEEFFDDHRNSCLEASNTSSGAFFDPKGKLPPQERDILSLYTTFIFKKEEASPPCSLGRTHSATDDDQQKDLTDVGEDAQDVYDPGSCSFTPLASSDQGQFYENWQQKGDMDGYYSYGSKIEKHCSTFSTRKNESSPLGQNQTDQSNELGHGFRPYKKDGVTKRSGSVETQGQIVKSGDNCMEVGSWRSTQTEVHAHSTDQFIKIDDAESYGDGSGMLKELCHVQQLSTLLSYAGDHMQVLDNNTLNNDLKRVTDGQGVMWPAALRHLHIAKPLYILSADGKCMGPADIARAASSLEGMIVSQTYDRKLEGWENNQARGYSSTVSRDNSRSRSRSHSTENRRIDMERKQNLAGGRQEISPVPHSDARAKAGQNHSRNQRESESSKGNLRGKDKS